MACERIKQCDETKRLYGQVLKRMFNLNEKRLYELRYADRQSIKETCFSMVSALMTGCASRPDNTEYLLNTQDYSR